MSANTGVWVKVFWEFAPAIMTILGGGAALWAVGKWRREHVGRWRMELAEDALAAMLEARDALGEIRSRLLFEGEASDRPHVDGEIERETEIRDRAYVVQRRYYERRDVIRRLRSLRYRFQIIFGAKSVEPFETATKVLWRLTWLADEWCLRKLNEHRHRVLPERRDENEAKIKELETALWPNEPAEDPLAPEVDAAIAQVEQLYREETRSRETVARGPRRVSQTTEKRE